MKNWIRAMRLRTLPLATSGIICGSLLSGPGYFRWELFLPLLLTAVLLQVLSNLANDYGDFIKGTDNQHRKGEQRMVAGGFITPVAMRNAVIIFAVLSFVSGVFLLRTANSTPGAMWWFLGLGIAAIAAAITYTIGKKAYGYAGFGDLAVLFFFGIASVSGSHYLMTGFFKPSVLLPAFAIGLHCVAVLNLNNLRDHENDRISGKKTLVVRMGFHRAKHYHSLLLSIPSVLLLTYTLLNMLHPWQFLFIPALWIFIRLNNNVKKCEDPSLLDGELKKQALTTLLLALLAGLGNYLAYVAGPFIVSQ